LQEVRKYQARSGTILRYYQKTNVGYVPRTQEVNQSSCDSQQETTERNQAHVAQIDKSLGSHL